MNDAKIDWRLRFHPYIPLQMAVTDKDNIEKAKTIKFQTRQGVVEMDKANEGVYEIIVENGKKTYYIDAGDMTAEQVMKVIEELKNERR